MTESTPAVRFSLDWWKRRHEAPDGYFPKMTQHWNWAIYPEMHKAFVEMAKPTLDDTALEIGAGYGQWMHPCSKLVRSVDGFDIHPSLVKKAAEKLADCPNAHMILGDGLTIPFADQKFSLVYSISVFQHMPRAIVRGYIRETARVLIPGGRAFFQFREADGDGPYSDDIVANHSGDFSVGWTLSEAEAACADAGLQVVEHRSGGHSLITLATAA